MLGYIRDAVTGAPLPGAHVFVLVDGAPIGTTSDVNGAYQWDPPDTLPDMLRVYVTYVGYAPTAADVSRFAGVVNWELVPGVNLDEVEIFPDPPPTVPAVAWGALALLVLFLAVADE